MAVSPSPWDVAREARGWTLRRANTAAPPQGTAVSSARGWLGRGLSFIYLGRGRKGERLHVNAGKYFLFFLFFCLETTLVLTMLNTGCIVSLCCCRSVNSVSGKSP